VSLPSPRATNGGPPDGPAAGDPPPFLFRHSARQILFGAGRVADLATIIRTRNVRRTVVVLDGALVGGDHERWVREALVGATEIVVHGVPIREPDTESVEACRALFDKFQPELVVAVGGGSTMDTAKVARILMSNPGTVEGMASFDRYFEPHGSVLVCIPTTAGTAAEVSEMAVIGVAGSDIKLRYRSQNMTAQFAVLDPELLLSMPPAVTAATGFDALTHAIEAYVSRGANLMTDPYAREALHRLAAWLPVAYREPGNLAARGHCLIGSMLAGVAFNSTQLGLAHAIAAPLGNMHHVVHGRANALALPAVLAYNAPSLGEKGRVIAEALGAASAADGVARIRRDLDLDDGLDSVVRDAGGREAIVAAAMKSGNIPFNPRTPTLGGVRAVVEAMRRPTGAGPVELDV
jgi:alcohol dehydrogenase class IV